MKNSMISFFKNYIISITACFIFIMLFGSLMWSLIWILIGIYGLAFGDLICVTVMFTTMIIACYIIYNLVKKGISIPAIITAIGSIILTSYLFLG